MIIKEEREFLPYEGELPRHTGIGFKIFDVPKDVFEILYKFYNRDLMKEEKYEGKDHYIKQPCYLQDINTKPHIVNYIKNELLNIHQDWAGVELEPAVLYGIRSYSNNSVFKAHTDRQDTHHIASTIVMAKDADWNLNIQDHNGQWYGVDVPVGKMIMFESGTCSHGRLDAFTGSYYDNIYIHYKFKK